MKFGLGKTLRACAIAALLAAASVLAPGLRAQQPAAPETFETWLAGLRKEAASNGISEATLDAALSDLKPDPVIIARDRLQPEHTQSLDAYVASHVTRKTIARGRTMARAQAGVL